MTEVKLSLGDVINIKGEDCVITAIGKGGFKYTLPNGTEKYISLDKWSGSKSYRKMKEKVFKPNTKDSWFRHLAR